jgi:hypothetical protein
MERVSFLAALPSLQHVTLLLPGLSLECLFFLTHRATARRRRKMTPWALLQPSFFETQHGIGAMELDAINIDRCTGKTSRDKSKDGWLDRETDRSIDR